jgi:hypothetical protein
MGILIALLPIDQPTLSEYYYAVFTRGLIGVGFVLEVMATN